MLSRPFDSLPLLQQVTKPIPLHFPQGNWATQLDLVFAHSDHLPIPSPGARFYGDLLASFKRIGCKHRNLMLCHLVYHRCVGSAAVTARKCCCIPHTREGNLPLRCTQTDSHRHYSDKPPVVLCFQQLCVLLPSVKPHSSGSMSTLPLGPVPSEPAAQGFTPAYFPSSVTDPGPRSGRNIFLPAPQTGHFHSSGNASNFTPLGIFPLRSPRSGSYRHPQFTI
jgi:hypothetical protein